MYSYNLPRYNIATKENRISHSQDDNMLVLGRRLHYKDVDFTNHGDPREHPKVPHEHTRKWDGPTILIGNKVFILKNTLSFRLPNKWGRYLYHILAPLESYSNGYWLISDTQIWRKANRDFIDLFCDGVHITNKEFFSIIQKSDYYIVSGYFQLNKAAVNDLEDTDIILIVKIDDSIYAEMDTEDPILFDDLCTNAQKKDFINIKIAPSPHFAGR